LERLIVAVPKQANQKQCFQQHIFNQHSDILYCIILMHIYVYTAAFGILVCFLHKFASNIHSQLTIQHVVKFKPIVLLFSSWLQAA